MEKSHLSNLVAFLGRRDARKHRDEDTSIRIISLYTCFGTGFSTDLK